MQMSIYYVIGVSVSLDLILILRYHNKTMCIQNKLSKLTLYITILLTLIIWDVDAEQLVDSVIAVVNGEAITQSELINEFRIESIMGKPLSREPTQGNKQEYLDRIISRKFVLQAAKRIGITANAHQQQIKQRLSEIRKGYTSETVFSQALKKQELEFSAIEKWASDNTIFDEYYTRQFIITIDKNEIDELAPLYFEENKNQFMVSTTVTFRSVLISVPQDSSEENKQTASRFAEIINSRFQQGETYEAIKQSYNSSKSISFSSHTLTTNTQLGAIVAQLKPTQRKGPLTVAEGYQIVELVKKTPGRQKQYSEVKDEIADLLRHNLAEAKYKKWLTKQKARISWYVFDNALNLVTGIYIQPKN